MRAADSSVTDAELWIAGVDGVVEIRPVGDLAPGASTSESTETAYLVQGRGTSESDAAYLARLHDEDARRLGMMAFGRGTGAIGPIVAGQALTTTTLRVPIVEIEGTEATTMVTNPSTTTASAEVAVDTDSFSTTLASGERLEHDNDVDASGTLTWTWSWTDSAGTAFGPVDASLEVEFTAPADVQVQLSDKLTLDADGDGVPSTGDTIQYTAVATNSGAATEVSLTLPMDPISTVGGVSTSGGSIVDVDGTVTVDWGEVSSTASATIDVTIGTIPDGSAYLSVQGVTNTGELTDDPSVSGDHDATRTPVSTSTPVLAAALGVDLAIDADLDGGASAGDTLRYTIQLENLGAATAHDLVVEVPSGANRTLVAGSVDADGVVPDDTEVLVNLGDLAGATTTGFHFDVLVTGGAGHTISTQGFVTGDDVSTETEVVVTTFAGVIGGEDAPVVTLLSPEPGSRVGAPTDITASVDLSDGASVASWRVLVDDVELGSGTTLPTSFGTFDPTLRENGLWTVRLEVVDDAGRTGVAEAPLEVSGAMKLGSYDLAFVDREWTSSAFTVTLLRSYSTLRKDSVGDFGYGWQLSMLDFTLQRNGPIGEGGWTQASCGDGFIWTDVCTTATTPHLVAVRWPDGTVEAFDAEPATWSSFFSALTTMAFTPRAGTTSTLAPVEGEESVAYLDGSLYTGLDTKEVYDPQQLWLTDKNGIRYLLDRDAGLVQTVDRDGNNVYFDDDGIHPDHGTGVSWARDTDGRITAVELPDGNSIQYTYDDAGDLTAVTDAEGFITTFAYEEHRLVAYGADGHEPVATMEYDADGRLVSTLDAAGVFVETSSDLSGWSETSTGPDPGLTTVSTYDANGLLVAVRTTHDATEEVWSWGYDEAFRATTQTSPTGAVTEVAYDDDGNVTDVIDPDGVHAEFAWTATGELEASWVDGALVSQTTYDAEGHPIEATSPSGLVLGSWTWTEWGSPSTWVDGDGLTGGVEYDAVGAVTALVAGDRRVEFVSDAFGVAIGIVDGEGAAGEAELDANGDLVGFTDANGYAQSWDVDEDGRIIGERDKLGRTTSYERDAAGNVALETRRTGTSVTYSYDEAGRLERVDPGDSWVAYAWDALDRLVRVENADVIVEYTYTPDGEIAEETSRPVTPDRLPEWSSAATWSGAGRLLGETTTAGSTTWSWDDAGRLATLEDSQTGTWSWSWDADGRLHAIDHDTGLHTELGWSDAGRLLDVDAGTVSVHLERDEYGRISAREDAAGRHTYTYDDRDQLIAVDHPEPLDDESWSYDANGNRLDGAVDADRLGDDGASDYSWDEDGRLIAKVDRETGAATTYTWNGLGQLMRIDTPDGSSTFLYDGLGRRVEVDHRGAVSRFVYSGQTVRATYDDTNTLPTWRSWDPWGGLLAEWSTAGVREAVLDQLGTVVAWEPGGASPARDSFGAGDPPSSVNPGALAWHDQDPTGLVFMRARFYDPSTGRFLSEDPLQGANAYRYANNNPVGMWDPLGLAAAAEYGQQTKKEAAQVEAKRKAAKEISCILIREATVAAVTATSAAAGEVVEIVLSGECEAKCKGRGLTVIGKNPDYLALAEALGAAVFSAPELEGLDPSITWPRNKAFLDDALKRGDCFVLANGAGEAGAGSGFGEELKHLKDQALGSLAGGRVLFPLGP